MHIYICPYCNPCREAILTIVRSDIIKCSHKQTTCERKKFDCKNVARCEKCGADFKVNKKFLKDQKRKIKDG